MAGTFQPIKVENPVDHPMHSEQIVVSKQVIQDVLDAENVVSVGHHFYEDSRKPLLVR